MAKKVDMKSSITLDEEITKNPGFPINHINILKEWARNQHHLPPIPDEKILLFHHSCMCDLEKTKACIETFYSVRSTTPEFFNNRHLSSKSLQATIDNATCFALPKKTSEGYLVLYQKVESTEVAKYNFDDSCKLFFMILDVLLQSEGTVPGIIFLLDYTNIRFGHLAKARLSSIRKMFQYVQEGIPVRLKSIHMVNMNYFIEKVMTFVKPFMNKELNELIHYHPEGTLTNLYDFIPKDCLPSNYGGNLPACETLKAKYMEDLMSLQDFFTTDERMFRCKELPGKKQSSKRPDSSQSLHSSFKSLDID